MKQDDSRLPFLDLLRALASQAIVWHHLAFYGPLSDRARASASALIDGLSQHARLAVQVFFVVSGYLTACGLLGREPQGLRRVWSLLAGRYRRIGLPYLGALLLALVANEVARHWMTHDSISARPSLGQLFAHVFLVHDLLGYEPLSAGIWYLAIDLQLTLLVGLVFWACAVASDAQASRRGQWVLVALGVSSLFWFNRDPRWDHFALYFMGAYGLGLVTAWTLAGSLRPRFLGAYSACLVLAVSVDFRVRLLVALATAWLLVLAQHEGWLTRWPRSRVVQALAATSYSLFLVHFPVSLVSNALWSSYLPATPAWSLLGMLAAYALSLLAAFVFHYEVELRLLGRGRPARVREAPISSS